MAHVEGICGEHKLVPPVRVNAVDQDGTVWDFEYSPDSVGVLQAMPRLPIRLRGTDSTGRVAEMEITELTVRPDWIERFLCSK
jgi:hypothetical protein